MPHLAPLPWNSAPIILWFVLTLIMASAWWHQPPHFPNLAHSATPTTLKW